MIRRNVASQPILLGPLTLKSNGDNVTSGASITVRKDGSPVTAAGTLNHVSDGVWEYVPTQGETDCALLGLILSASNAYAVALTVPTTRLPLQTSGVLPDVAANNAGGLPVLDSNSTVPANVTRFGGVAGTFSSGRPEVNTTHWDGTATSSANVRANVVQIAGQTANASAAVTFPANIGTSTLDAAGVWSHTTRTLTSGAAPSVADIWSHATRTLTGTTDANVVQIAGQTANASAAVTFPANVGTSTLDAAGVWGHSSRTLTGNVNANVVQVAGQTANASNAVTFPSTIGTSTLNASDVWGHTTRTLTGTTDANVVQIAGQTANASAAVTFPATIGTSTLDAAGVWGHSSRTLTSGAAPSVSDIWNHTTRTLTDTVDANVVQIAGQTASASAAVTFPSSIGTSTLDAAGVWNHTTRTLTSGAAPSVSDIWSHTNRTLTSTVDANVIQWDGTAVDSATVRANVVQIAGQTANASSSVTFPGSVGSSTLAAADVWSHTTRTLTSGAAPSVADIWSHSFRTLTGNVDANVVQIAGQTANATAAVTFPSNIGTSTLDAGGVWSHATRTLTSGAAPSVADIWSHSSRTLTGNVNANVVQIAGQTANASSAVTFPASIGTSTLDAPGVWNHTSRTLTSGAAPSVADIWSHTNRTLTSGAAPSVADIWSHSTRTLTGTVNANVVQIAGQNANAATAVTFPASVGTSTLDAASVWSHTTRTITGGTLTTNPPTVAQIVAGVWDASLAAHSNSGSTGEALHQLDTNITAIKGKTDQLTFTLGRVDANATAVIQGADVTLIVNGTTQGVIAGLGSARITIRSPLSPRGKQLFITPGDDYYLSDRAVPEWEEDGAGWPVLTGATVTLAVNGGTLLIPCTVVTATGSNKKVRVEMSRTVSAQIHEAPYELVATLADTGRKFTLAKGMVVLE